MREVDLLAATGLSDQCVADVSGHLAGGIGEDVVPAALHGDADVLEAPHAGAAHVAALGLEQAQDGAVHGARRRVQIAVHVAVDQEDLCMLRHQIRPQPRPHLRSVPDVLIDTQPQHFTLYLHTLCCAKHHPSSRNFFSTLLQV